MLKKSKAKPMASKSKPKPFAEGGQVSGRRSRNALGGRDPIYTERPGIAAGPAQEPGPDMSPPARAATRRPARSRSRSADMSADDLNARELGRIRGGDGGISATETLNQRELDRIRNSTSATAPFRKGGMVRGKKC